MNTGDSHIVDMEALRLPHTQTLSRNRARERAGRAYFTFGAEAVDAVLTGRAKIGARARAKDKDSAKDRAEESAARGLPLARLHEVHAAEPEDSSSAAAFVSLLAVRSRGAAGEAAAGMEKGPIVWVRDHGDARKQGWIYPPGLAQLGINPDHILYVGVNGSIAVLRAAADAVRSASIGAVIIELAGKNPKGLNLTATRRLSLFAQKSGVTVFLLRSQPASSLAAMPSAGFSRWQVASAPSRALAANAVGHPVFDITLLRHRGGVDGLTARLEWNRDTGSFQAGSFEEAADIGAVPAISGIGTDREEIRKSA